MRIEWSAKVYRVSGAHLRAVFCVVLASAALAGCASKPGITRVRLSERECLARAMYFESNRSSDAGMLAVGTVVMNRVRSGRYGATVCEVVGAPRQFAPGVLTRPMADSGAPRARRVADAVLAGRRHPGVQNAQFFHTAGYKFPYNNMRYVLVAGGNAFYDKTKAPKTWWGGEGRWGPPPAPSERIDGGPILVANVEAVNDEPAPRRAVSAPPAEVVRVASVAPSRRGSVAGVSIFEPEPPRGGYSQVASLEPEMRPASRLAQPQRTAAIREDNGLREEDRWRDEELAAEQGVRPAANDRDWTERRDRTVESAPLPVVQPAPEPIYEPRPSRDVRVASRQPRAAEPARTVQPSRTVAADPAALGWNAGPAPARIEGDTVGYGGDERGADQVVQEEPVRAPARATRRSYGGGSYDDARYGYR